MDSRRTRIAAVTGNVSFYRNPSRKRRPRKGGGWKQRGLVLLLFLLLLLCLMPYVALLRFSTSAGRGIDAASSSATAIGGNAMGYLLGQVGFGPNEALTWKDKIALLQKTQLLAYDSRYLPPYRPLEDWLPYGHVMQELGQRILSRQIASSHVLIMGDGGSVVSNLTRMAQQQDHVTHVVSTNAHDDNPNKDAHNQPEYLDTWWSNQNSAFDEDSSSSAPTRWWSPLTSSWTSRPKSKPNWLLLTVLDNEQVFSSPEGAVQFFESGPPTMTYIIVGVTATLTTHGTYHNYSFTGMKTIRMLQELHYKVQLLSATDFWSNGAAYQMTHDDTVFLPNALINKDDLQDFFEWGAQAAATSRALVTDSNKFVNFHLQKPEFNMTTSEHAQQAPLAMFKGYLFCTQGLDLAIPSRREYLQDHKFGTQESWAYPYRQHEAEKRKMVQRVNFKTCGDNTEINDGGELAFYTRNRQNHSRLRVEFEGSKAGTLVKGIRDASTILCDGQDVTKEVTASKKYKLWTNTKTHDLAISEAFCVKLDCSDFAAAPASPDRRGTSKNNEQVSCATRILPVSRKATIQTALERKNNLLVVLLDPISRAQFDYLFPTTVSQILVNDTASFGFINFEKYTTVGNNSGPNQAALYAGQHLLKHDGIGKSDGHTDKWIWDQLNDAGYSTFKAEDGCIANSNMVQSMKPNTTHGQALHELFCFHFARPNCVGGQLAAEHLLDHAKQFVEAYSDPSNTRPWAAFLSLVDTHEDTMTLGAIIDNPLHRFLSWALSSPSHLDDTTIMVLSDHGLHYGPYFQSTSGERERSEPILFVRPSNRQPETVMKNLAANAKKFVTAFDVHKTMLDLVGIHPASTFAIGSSLLEVLPESRSSCSKVRVIPDRHCELVESHDVQQSPLVSPPSLASFFADIPRDHRWKQETCRPSTQNIQSVLKAVKSSKKLCKCATSHRNWFLCTDHPWDTGNLHPEEYFVTIHCEGFHLHYETRVVRNDELLQQRRVAASDRVTDKKRQPNILVLEVDSVSIAYADRHFSLTRKLLRQHHIVNTDEKCPGGICGVDFSNFGVVGPNSVSNQVASLSGCFATQRHLSCFRKKIELGDICEDPSAPEFGMKVQSLGPNLHTVYCPANSTNPFLYNVAKRKGYLTYFGEEFCYNGSPWVVQDNVFPLDADFAPHKMFCRLAQKSFPDIPEDKLFRKKVGGRCVDFDRGIRLHDVGLQLLHQMWDTYSDVPKFAYLNAIAAHTYTSNTAKMALSSEEYDEKLSTLLGSFLLREDRADTIIIVRSDHGFQGGDAATVDYSTQIESVRPWTEILVPEGYPVDSLLANRAKVVTPFDLYTLIRDLIVGGNDTERPRWMHDPLHETVPDDQSCKERKIPGDFCPTRETPAPSFGVCNMFESKQAVFCRDPTNGVDLYNSRTEYDMVSGRSTVPDFNQALQDLKGTQVSDQAKNSSSGLSKSIQNFSATKATSSQSLLIVNKALSAITTDLVCRVKHGKAAANTSVAIVQPIWLSLDTIVSEYRGKSKVSGGIFLYPRQSIILTSILQLLTSKLQDKQNEVVRVCETGFGAGHSAALFLAASPRIEVISFDKFDRPYQVRNANLLKQQFGPTRLQHIVGDTCNTVPEFRFNNPEIRCDFIHGSSFCPSDMLGLLQILKPNGIVTATAMKGITDKDVYFGPKAQWRQLRQNDCITNITCWKEEAHELKESFVFAKAGTKMEHAFCAAQNTGRCSVQQGDSSVSVDTSGLELDRLCTASRVNVPA